MHLRTVLAEEVSSLYNRLTQDFPANQILPLALLKRLIRKKHFQAYYLIADTEICGYAILTPFIDDHYIDIEYLAIDQRYRGKGYGQQLIKEIQKQVGIEHIILQVEDPNHSQSDKQRMLRNKRIQFYQKSNLRLVDSISVKLAQTYLLPMVNWDISDEALESKLKHYFKKAYGRIWCFFFAHVKRKS